MQHPAKICLVIVATLIGLEESKQFNSAGLSSTLLNGTVYFRTGIVPVFKQGVIDRENGTAYGIYNDTLSTTGWGLLDIKAGYASGVKSEEAMYAAGYLEGALTYKQIYNHYQNLHAAMIAPLSENVLAKLQNFINKQQQWLLEEMSLHPNDPAIHAASLIQYQLLGLIDGYTAVAPSNMALDVFAFQALNMAGDLIDLLHVVNPSGRPNFNKMSKEELKSYIRRNSHCSALIKVKGAYENIFFSHSSWFLYQLTNRIFKFYDFNIEEAASKQVSFSSYPGFLESLDDFYMMGNGLVMLQTTNNVFNTSLYDLVSPQSLPAWFRVRAANMMAKNASEWGQWISKYNSGTYNNQYMVLDLNKVKLNTVIEDNALWVVEQIPGLVEYADQTAELRLGYWPSYNVPYFEKVYNMSGYPKMVEEKGLDFSYQLAPRAKIFRRDQGKVTDMDSMMHIMRYNDYTKDPYSEKNACDTICCRGDLVTASPKPDGCYDTKVADIHMAQERQAWAVNGPTRGDSLMPYTWQQFKNISHVGLPDTYNFKFELMKPIL